MKKIAAIAALVALSISTSAIASETQIYTWKNDRGNNVYADTPKNLKIDLANSINVRTGTVTPPEPTQKMPAAPANAMEAQQMANEMILAENKKRAEEAARQAEQTRAENCKAAQMNRANAEKARNRDELIPRFDAAVAQFCS